MTRTIRVVVDVVIDDRMTEAKSPEQTLTDELLAWFDSLSFGTDGWSVVAADVVTEDGDAD